MIEKIKNIWIYDIEVFKHDWLVVFQSVDQESLINVIHNDREKMISFLRTVQPVLCGFNNKSYDDYIMLSILTSGEPEQVKAHNDWIIGGNQGFEFPAIQGEFKGNYFESFDLRDDLPMDLSLKAIEGNMNNDIRESRIDFTINHKLDEAELEEVTTYCKADVANTMKLFKARKAYLDGKLKVAKLGNIPAVKALGMTNPKLAAYFLQAKKLDNPNEGALVYNPPECLRLEKYKEALDFYLAGVGYEKSLTIQAKDLKLVYGWGGIHGAIEHSSFESTEDFKIVDIDVGSYYPSMILRLGYYPSSIPSPKGYEEVYTQRLAAKHSGDSDTADALKLVLNSTYGALKNQYNPLYEPRVANHICISGQLLLTMLIEHLETIPSVKIIQANTDGIMLGYNPKYETQVQGVVINWENVTKLNMEYTEIKKITQKDVNNYVMVVGATYLIDENREKHVTKDDSSKVVVKGSYVSLFKGGDFRNNSLVIIHKAIANYFLDGILPEETINKADNVLDFQMVCKTGHTYDGCVYEMDGRFLPVQRVNRVYAAKGREAGTLYKVKGERKDKIASIPDHCLIDNTGKNVKLDMLDKKWYIELATKRINDYLGVKPNNKIKKKKETQKMATTKKEAAPELKAPRNVYQKLAQARLDFLNSNPQKTGKNRHVGYKYFTLDDIIPKATKALADNGLVFIVGFEKDEATGRIVDVDDYEMFIIFNCPIVNVEANRGMNELQCLGAVQTYVRRYLWFMAMDIVEADTFDEIQEDNSKAPAEKPVHKAPPTPAERKEIAKEVAKPAVDAQITELQKKSIKTGLEELQKKGGEHRAYIKTIAKEVKAGVTSERAEAILDEIGKKLYPAPEEEQ